MTPSEVRVLGQSFAVAQHEANQAAERDAFRVQTDFIGRMNSCFAEVYGLYDDHAETFPEREDREEAIEKLTSLADLCIALVALLRMPEPVQS